jgi:hypothetical protein
MPGGARRGPRPSAADRAALFGLAAIVVAAGTLRLWGLDFGLPQTLTRPDEETIASVTGRLMRGGANPGFFRYPTLFMYVMAAIDRVWFGTPDAAPEASVYWAARFVSALAGTLTVPLLFYAARRFFSTSVALAAAALLAVTFLHVRDSHFGVTDVAATFLIVAAFSAIVFGPFERPSSWNVALAGFLCGLAAATKYNAGLILAALLAVVPSVAMAAVGVGTAALGFLAGTPYALLARKQFLADLLAERAHLAAGHTIAASVGWVHHLVFSLRYGLGIPFLVAAIAGAIWLAAVDRRRAKVVLAFPLLYYLVMGGGRVVFIRYMTPLTPFAALLAAYAIERVASIVGRDAEARYEAAVPGATASRYIMAGLVALIAADSARRSIELDRLLAQRDSRALAAEYVRARYPRGVSLYQVGTNYGHVVLSPESDYPNWALGFEPRLVLVERSWLAAYTSVPPSLADDLARGSYRLVHRIDVENRSSAASPVFDQQDAFFAPLTGFDRFVRPGPAIEIYEKR